MGDISLNDVSKLMVGLSWDPNTQATEGFGLGQPHNIDLCCAVFGEGLSFIDMITPQIPLREKYGQQIFHTGDNTSGGADFEDEAINVTFDGLDEDIKYLAFIVSCIDGVKFSELNNPVCDFLVYENLEKLASVKLSKGQMDHILTGVVRKNHLGEWELTDLNQDLDNTGTAQLTETLRDRL